MELTCYTYPKWRLDIRPASAKRAWMDQAPEAFAYRCLPLNIANAHGWEILCPCDFEAVWDGGGAPGDVRLSTPPDTPAHMTPVALFGQGTITFHINGIFRTPPGWNLWVGGSPNAAKDGIAPLTGVIETDWAPFTFTMNWRFTRPHHLVQFRQGEPICFIFPVERNVLEEVRPKIVPIESEPELKAQFETWSQARNAFQEKVVKDPPAAPADKWQKHYYRGVDASERSHINDHRSKLRLDPFKGAPADDLPRFAAPTPLAVKEAGAAQALLSALEKAQLNLRKREWLLEVMEAHRHLSPSASGLMRCEHMSGEEFLNLFYAPGRPVILAGEMTDWPALTRWTPSYLKTVVGSRVVEYQGDRDQHARSEWFKEAHKREAPFDAFIDRILQAGPGNDSYITAYNSARNQDALSVLHSDMGILPKFLNPAAPHPHGMMWIGPADTFTALHHDLTNNFLAQIVGRKQVLLAPAAEAAKLYNSIHVFSDVTDLRDPSQTADRPDLARLRLYDIVLESGDILFIPVGWWHQVRALDFSVSVTYTNFHWPNDWAQGYPA